MSGKKSYPKLNKIKKFIIIRNLIEHHQATIRQKDLDEMGSNNIKLYDIFSEEKKYKVNDKVEITLSELCRVKKIVEEAANILIPHCS